MIHQSSIGVEGWVAGYHSCAWSSPQYRKQNLIASPVSYCTLRCFGFDTGFLVVTKLFRGSAGVDRPEGGEGLRLVISPVDEASLNRLY